MKHTARVGVVAIPNELKDSDDFATDQLGANGSNQARARAESAPAECDNVGCLLGLLDSLPRHLMLRSL